MAVAEKVGFAVGHAVMRFLSVTCVALVIGSIIWAVYVSFVKPHTNPTKNTLQQAEKIENVDIDNHYGILHFKLGPIEFGL